MRLLTGFLEIVGVFIALCAWGLIPDLLWEYDYKLCAIAAFLLIPVGLLYLVQRFYEWRSPRLIRSRNKT
jgi:hypothetical protein